MVMRVTNGPRRDIRIERRKPIIPTRKFVRTHRLMPSHITDPTTTRAALRQNAHDRNSSK
jgi:hypothetical protein